MDIKTYKKQMLEREIQILCSCRHLSNLNKGLKNKQEMKLIEKINQYKFFRGIDG